MKMPVTVIVAMNVLDCAHAEDYVRWAVDQMVDGSYSESLAILAGFDQSASSFELRKYFQKVKK